MNEIPVRYKRTVVIWEGEGWYQKSRSLDNSRYEFIPVYDLGEATPAGTLVWITAEAIEVPEPEDWQVDPAILDRAQSGEEYYEEGEE